MTNTMRKITISLTEENYAKVIAEVRRLSQIEAAKTVPARVINTLISQHLDGGPDKVLKRKPQLAQTA